MFKSDPDFQIVIAITFAIEKDERESLPRLSSESAENA
jgi:hypothetical protein